MSNIEGFVVTDNEGNARLASSQEMHSFIQEQINNKLLDAEGKLLPKEIILLTGLYTQLYFDLKQKGLVNDVLDFNAAFTGINSNLQNLNSVIYNIEGVIKDIE